MNFYSLYSRSQNRYNVPFLANDNNDAIDRVVKMVASQGDTALMSSLDDLELDLVGLFEPMHYSHPVEELLDVELVLDDLHKNLPLPPHLKETLDKYYNGGTVNA